MEVPVFEKLKDRSEIEKEKIVKIGTLWIDKKMEKSWKKIQVEHYT